MCSRRRGRRPPCSRHPRGSQPSPIQERDAGWRGDPRLAQLGYAVGSALRYTVGAALGEFLAIMLDESMHATLEGWTGMSIEEIVDLAGQRFPLQLALAEEALELVDALM